MNKLFKLKKWLTVPEAAKHLSGILEEQVTEADVLRLALDRHLRISVDLVNGCMAKAGRIIPEHAAKRVPSIDPLCEEMIVLGISLSPDEILELDKEMVSMNGVWDLPMIGGEEICVEQAYQKSSRGPAVTATHSNGVFLGTPNQGLFQLQTDWADARGCKDRAKGKSVYDPDRYFPACSLPADTVFVVRTEALREFEASISEISPSPEKPLTTTERNTLLTVIAALCDYSDIAHQARGAAAQVAKMTDELGAPVTDDTIRAVLAKIPYALESRMK